MKIETLYSQGFHLGGVFQRFVRRRVLLGTGQLLRQVSGYSGSSCFGFTDALTNNVQRPSPLYYCTLS